MRNAIRAMAVVGVILAAAGCSDRQPDVYPITGSVTYGGKPYARLLVYFRPAAGPVDKYGSNLGVGETDKNGVLTVKSACGAGLQPGDYKVTFALYKDSKTGTTIGGSEKPEERGVVTRQVVAPPFDDQSSQSTTPVTFTVKSGENAFTYDIPAGK